MQTEANSLSISLVLSSKFTSLVFLNRAHSWRGYLVNFKYRRKQKSHVKMYE